MFHNKFPQILLSFILIVFIAVFIISGIFLSKSTALIKSGIGLYTEPNINSHFVTSVTKSTPLIAIYHTGTWVKVGDESNGTTGWMLQSNFKQIEDKQAIAVNNGILTQQDNHELHAVTLSQQYEQILSLEQKLNKGLNKLPDQKTVVHLEKEYLSQLLLIEKMIKDMQPQQDRPQKLKQ